MNPLTQYPDNWYQPYPFLSVLNSTGSALLFSSQIAPDNYVSSMQNGLALDPAGNIYMVGNTQGGQTYFVGNTTLTSWPTTQGTYSTPQTGTGTIPFFVKVAALLSPTTTTLTVTPGTATTGQNVTFYVTVAGTTQTSPTPTGTVTLTNTAVNPSATLATIDLNAGTGSWTTSSLGVGSYTVVGTYSSDSVYDWSTSSSVPVTINNTAQATITLGNLNQTYTGSPLAATATTVPANQPVTITYNGSTTAPTNVANYSVVATIPSGGNYSGTASGTLAIHPANQTITFGSIPGQTVGATVALSATSTSHLPVSFSSTTPAFCSVSGTTATMLAPGTCTIQASQAGNTNFAATTAVSESFTVTSASGFKLVATPNSETIRRGDLAAFLLEAQSLNGFSGSVKISCSGSLSGSVCGDFPQTLKLLPNKTALAISGILFPKTTAPGTYTLTFTGTSGSVTASTTANFTVQQ